MGGVLLAIYPRPPADDIVYKVRVISHDLGYPIPQRNDVVFIVPFMPRLRQYGVYNLVPQCGRDYNCLLILVNSDDCG